MTTGEKCQIRGCDQRSYTHQALWGKAVLLCAHHYRAFVEGGMNQLYGGEQALELEDKFRTMCLSILENTERNQCGFQMKWTCDDIRKVVQSHLKELE